MRQLKVGSVMTTDVVHTEHDASFKEIAGTLAEHRVGGLPVVDEDGHVVGVVSETDLTIHQAETRLVHEPPAAAGSRGSHPAPAAGPQRPTPVPPASS